MKSLRGYPATYSPVSYEDVDIAHLNYEEENAPKNYLEQIRYLLEEGNAGGYVSAFDRGFSGGLGRKVGGFINAVGSYPVDRAAEWLGYENVPSFSDRYKEIVQQADMSEQQLRQDNPYAAMGTEMLGNVLGLGNAAYGIAGRFGLNGVTRMGGAGAIDAAVNTFGGADTLSEAITTLPQNTATGFAGGAVMGKLGDIGSRYGSRLMDWGQSKLAANLNNQMRSEFTQAAGHQLDIPQAVANRQQAYDNFVTQNAGKEVVDFMPREPIEGSAWYGNVVPDNTPVKMINIDENLVPDFKRKAQLREWLKGKFENIDNTVVESTGEVVNLNNSAAGRIVKNSRNGINNLAYPQLDEVVSRGYYSGMRPTDMRHINRVQGQNIYHSGIMYKGKPYAVEYYVDQPLDIYGMHNYAGQNIKKVKQIARDEALTPLTNGSKLPKQPASMYNISSLRGNVNRNLPNVSTLYNELTPTQVGLMDNALRQGLGQTNQKAGTLASMDKIRQAAYQQNGVSADLSAVRNNLNKVMTPHTGRLDSRIAQAKRLEDYYQRGYNNQAASQAATGQQFHNNVEKQAYLQGQLQRLAQGGNTVQSVVDNRAMLQQLMPDFRYNRLYSEAQRLNDEYRNVLELRAKYARYLQDMYNKTAPHAVNDITQHRK